MNEVRFAWELATIADAHLKGVERSKVYATIGAGDTFAAIGMLMRKLVAAQLAIGSDLRREMVGWLDSYSEHPDQRRLHRLIASVATREPDPESAPVVPLRYLTIVSAYKRPDAK